MVAYPRRQVLGRSLVNVANSLSSGFLPTLSQSKIAPAPWISILNRVLPHDLGFSLLLLLDRSQNKVDFPFDLLQTALAGLTPSAHIFLVCLFFLLVLKLRQFVPLREIFEVQILDRRVDLPFLLAEGEDVRLVSNEGTAVLLGAPALETEGLCEG
jgi:hypothetical protein